MKVLLKRVGKDLEIIETDKKYVNEVLKELLGPYVRQGKVLITDNFKLYYDELSYINNGKINFYIKTNNPYESMEEIKGDIVFIENRPVNYWLEEIWDYEVIDVSETNIKMANDILNESYEYIKEMFDHGILDTEIINNILNIED